jgi:FeS assembly SUF system protein
MSDHASQIRRVPLTVLRFSETNGQYTAEPAPAEPPTPRPAPPPAAPAPGHQGELAAHCNREPKPNQPMDEMMLESKIVENLRLVYDPEIPVNVYDLGLIYDIYIYPPDNEVRVLMTLTAPGCPVAGSIVAEVEARVESLPEIKRCDVELVWAPQWGREMMSEVARLELGM